MGLQTIQAAVGVVANVAGVGTDEGARRAIAKGLMEFFYHLLDWRRWLLVVCVFYLKYYCFLQKKNIVQDGPFQHV